MKIAVIFFGQLRTSLEASSNLQRFFGSNKIDFFVHTWDTNTHRRPLNLKIPDNEHEQIKHEVFDKFIQIYQPINIIIEKQKEYWARITDRYGYTGDLTNLWHSCYYSDQLRIQYEKLNNFKYDVVVRLRPDSIFPPDRFLDQDIQNFFEDRNSLYYLDLFGDTYHIAGSKTMSIATNFYKNLPMYGNTDWLMPKFIEYLNNKGIQSRIMNDNRGSILREEYKNIDPNIYYYHLSLINSIIYEQINFGKEMHNCTFTNLSNPNWRSDMRDILSSLFLNPKVATEYFDFLKK